MKTSYIAIAIQKAVANNSLSQPFSVSDVNRNCNELLVKSPSFLSKHTKGNPGNFKPYFIRFSRGKYLLIV
jgi:hypothetical protein